MSAQLIDPASLVIQTVNLAIIVFVLWKFFFKPYLTYLDEENTKRIKLEADIANSAHIIDNANAEAAKILDSSRVDARNLANEILENARKDADNMRADAALEAEEARKKGFADVEHERRTLREEMKERVVSVALKMNEKLFGKNEANEQFLKNSHKDINF